MKMWLLPIILISLTIQAEAGPLRVYLAPSGDDAADGLSARQPIKSLGRAQEVVMQAPAARTNDVEIRIAPGTYSGQTVRWSFYVRDHTISFLADGDTPPLFKGDNKSTWFTFTAHADGARTGLVFQNIHVQTYGTAISFGGKRTLPNSSSSGNTITGCQFTHIGEDSTAAVRFVNSASNRVENCQFTSIMRRTQKGLLHAIYAAHNCVGNMIVSNRFELCCGDPVRLRDASDENVIEGNLFIRSGVEGAVTDWYCDHDTEHDCTKPTPECPSWNNTVKGNRLDRSFSGGALEAAKVYSKRIPSGCAAPAPNANRFIVSGNSKP